jgi:hypothetical protein
MRFFLVATFIFLCLTSLVMAKPFVVCDPYPVAMSLDGFRIQFDGGAWVDIPLTINPDGTKQIHYDLGPLNLSTGNHVVKAKAYNVWGDSDESLPFSFPAGKPGSPTTLFLSAQ